MSDDHNAPRGWLRRNLAWSNSSRSWEERIGLVLILSAGMLLLWFRAHVPIPMQVVGWGSVCVISALLFRRGWFKLFGPILFYDLVRVARQPRYFWLRTLYAVLLTMILGWVYWTWTLSHRYDGAG